MSYSASTRKLIFSSRSLLCFRNQSSVAHHARKEKRIPDGPNLKHFMQNRSRNPKVIPGLSESHAYINAKDINGDGRKVMFVTYGCQMNVNDMEVVRSILLSNGYDETLAEADADVILFMTCSIREGAETKIWRELKRLNRLQSRSRTVAVLGCMAERVRHSLLDKGDLCQVVAGPDSYRDLPRLLAVSRHGQKALNVQLSLDETYADVVAVRKDPEGKSAFVSIMRGCENMCTYCVVPFTRGRERSRPIDSILDEVKRLSDEGVKQVILLGQNVNSYRDISESKISWGKETATVPGFSTVYRPKSGGRTFVTLLDEVSRVDPEMRIRFTSPHPKDFPLELIQLIRDRPNICKQLHLPAQSGDDEVLDAMGRGYTAESYLQLVSNVRDLIPDVSLTSDFIAGFCGESEDAHQRTIRLMKQVKYSFCYVFPYSMREGTRAHRRLVDDVPPETKRRRHEELAATFREVALQLNSAQIGRQHLVLVEGAAKRNPLEVTGRTDGGTTVNLPNQEGTVRPGDYVAVQVESATSQSMRGRYLAYSSIAQSATFS